MYRKFIILFVVWCYADTTDCTPVKLDSIKSNCGDSCTAPSEERVQIEGVQLHQAHLSKFNGPVFMEPYALRRKKRQGLNEELEPANIEDKTTAESLLNSIEETVAKVAQSDTKEISVSPSQSRTIDDSESTDESIEEEESIFLKEAEDKSEVLSDSEEVEDKSGLLSQDASTATDGAEETLKLATTLESDIPIDTIPKMNSDSDDDTFLTPKETPSNSEISEELSVNTEIEETSKVVNTPDTSQTVVPSDTMLVMSDDSDEDALITATDTSSRSETTDIQGTEGNLEVPKTDGMSVMRDIFDGDTLLTPSNSEISGAPSVTLLDTQGTKNTLPVEITPNTSEMSDKFDGDSEVTRTDTLEIDIPTDEKPILKNDSDEETIMALTDTSRTLEITDDSSESKNDVSLDAMPIKSDRDPLLTPPDISDIFDYPTETILDTTDTQVAKDTPNVGSTLNTSEIDIETDALQPIRDNFDEDTVSTPYNIDTQGTPEASNVANTPNTSEIDVPTNVIKITSDVFDGNTLLTPTDTVSTFETFDDTKIRQLEKDTSDKADTANTSENDVSNDQVSDLRADLDGDLLKTLTDNLITVETSDEQTATRLDSTDIQRSKDGLKETSSTSEISDDLTATILDIKDTTETKDVPNKSAIDISTDNLLTMRADLDETLLTPTDTSSTSKLSDEQKITTFDTTDTQVTKDRSNLEITPDTMPNLSVNLEEDSLTTVPDTSSLSEISEPTITRLDTTDIQDTKGTLKETLTIIKDDIDGDALSSPTETLRTSEILDDLPAIPSDTKGSKGTVNVADSSEIGIPTDTRPFMSEVFDKDTLFIPASILSTSETSNRPSITIVDTKNTQVTTDTSNLEITPNTSEIDIPVAKPNLSDDLDEDSLITLTDAATTSEILDEQTTTRLETKDTQDTKDITEIDISTVVRPIVSDDSDRETLMTSEISNDRSTTILDTTDTQGKKDTSNTENISEIDIRTDELKITNDDVDGGKMLAATDTSSLSEISDGPKEIRLDTQVTKDTSKVISLPNASQLDIPTDTMATIKKELDGDKLIAPNSVNTEKIINIASTTATLEPTSSTKTVLPVPEPLDQDLTKMSLNTPDSSEKRLSIKIDTHLQGISDSDPEKPTTNAQLTKAQLSSKRTDKIGVNEEISLGKGRVRNQKLHRLLEEQHDSDVDDMDDSDECMCAYREESEITATENKIIREIEKNILEALRADHADFLTEYGNKCNSDGCGTSSNFDFLDESESDKELIDLLGEVSRSNYKNYDAIKPFDDDLTDDESFL